MGEWRRQRPVKAMRSPWKSFLTPVIDNWLSLVQASAKAPRQIISVDFLQKKKINFFSMMKL
jgi:hypothetical protein